MKLVQSAFNYWSDGSTLNQVMPPLSNPANAKPFVVRFSQRGWIAANVIVWGADEQEARSRVMLAIETCMTEIALRAPASDRNRQDYDCARNIYEQVEEGLLKVDVEAFDINVITKVSWACNDGVLT